MIIITAVSICLFIPETTPLPPETDYANTPEESGIYNSDTEKLPALSENTDTQSTEASYADIVLEEAFRTIRADYHTFISETRKMKLKMTSAATQTTAVFKKTAIHRKVKQAPTLRPKHLRKILY